MKNIWVAGSGSGIGEQLLKTLSNKKDTLVFGSSRRGLPLGDNFVSGTNYKLDLRKEQEIVPFLKAIKDKLNTLDAVYITLGDGLFSPIESIPQEDWDKHFELNVKAPFLILKNLKNLLNSNSFVCLLSSTAARMGFPESTAYCASKHAILGLARSIREEWKPDGIRVFNVSPGAIDTPIWEGREGFNREDMIPVQDFAELLASYIDLPSSLNLEDVYVLPKKGIL